MSDRWRKVENENGYPSYVNERTNVKQWDHPKFADIKQTIDECNYIKFSAYRVATKIRVLQRGLYMDEISISLISTIFEKHHLGVNEGSLQLESYDLEAILSDLYFAANKQNHTNTDIDFACELMQNFLYNIYDKDRKGKLQVTSVKISLALLSSAKLSELYRYFYSLCSDYNNIVTRFKLQNLLFNLTCITKFLHEDMHFGPQIIQTSLDSCFKECSGAVGITEAEFLNWFETGPQILSYIPTLYRMRIAENVTHNSRCSVCKSSPIIGLRYRCLRCSRYSQCQRCFLSARISHSHKPGHPMREYCTEKSSKELTHVFVKRLCNMLRCSLKLTSNPSDLIEPRSLKSDKEYLLKSFEAETECKVLPLSCPQIQLQVIIRQLELQNRELQSQVAQLHSRNDKEMKKYLEEHRLHIVTQIQKLKQLKDYLQNAQKPEVNHIQSTPMVANARGINFEYYTPRIQPPDFSVIPETSSGEKWQPSRNTTQTSMEPYSIRDISTWIADRPTTSSSMETGATSSTYIPINSNDPKGHVAEMQSDLDAVLDKLQQILANNFSLDDSLSSADNDQLQEAVSEMEGMLTSLIDGVENSRANSALNSFPLDKETLLL